MSDNLIYRVLPQEVYLQPVPDPNAVFLTDSERAITGGFNGWKAGALWGGICIVLILLGGHFLVAIIFPSLVIAIMALFTKLGNASELEWRKEEKTKKVLEEKQRIETENQKAIRRVEDEAVALTVSLSRTYESSLGLATELSQHLHLASDLLRQAEVEYQENAFAPFWDAVEKAAKQLAAFNDKANQLSNKVPGYYQMLSGRKHTFPPFPDNPSALQYAPSVTRELRRIVRLGQTNFQFANIWEHRRTRDVLIAGFRTLGEAIDNLGATIEYSISKLQESVSSDVAKLVEQEIRTRDALDKRMREQNRLLDNIQHGREPKRTDSPSRY